MRPQSDPRYQQQFQPLASPSLPPADVVDFRGYFKVETFGHGAVIYRPGMPADKVYLLRSGRVRLLRQMVTESVLLALVGAAAGALLARVGLKLMLQLVPPALANTVELRLDLTRSTSSAR